MFDTSSIILDSLLQEELSENIKKRVIDQKFSYIGNGAELYFKSAEFKKDYKKRMSGSFVDNSANKFSAPLEGKDEISKVYLPSDGYYEFMKDRGYRNYKICIISLGCGDANQEKVLLENLALQGKEVEYFGVDISQEMLNIAKNNLKDINIGKNFIRADITTKKFRDEIDRLTKGFEIRVFAFLGGTFGNFSQAHIAQSLSNIMGWDDLLWFDVLLRPGVSEIDNDKLYQRYLSYLSFEPTMSSNFRPLAAIGIPYENGKIQLATAEESSIGSLLFKYYFEFSIDTNVTYNSENFYFLKGEKVGLIDIRVYYKDTFLSFLDKFKFFLIDDRFDGKEGEVGRAQFLFKKANEY